MIRRSLTMATAVAALFVPAFAAAKVEEKPVEEKRLVSGKQTLSAELGYIYLHTPARTSILLIKEPSAEELAAYETEWREAFDEARSKYPRELESWRRGVEWAREQRKKIPERPIEPTEANFSIGRLDQRMLVTVGPQFIYAKQGEEFSYLHELEPGTYRYYGPMFVLPNGVAGGTCFCMGSVKFEVKAGKITNLGDFLTLGWVTLEQGRASALEWNGSASPRVTDYSLPERLAAFPNEQADWRAAGKIDNFYGITVGRMPAVPGVLAYERDTVIDLKAGGGSTSAGAP